MTGRAVVSTNGRIGPLSDWSIDLSAVPHSPVQGNPETPSVSYSAGTQRDTHLAMNNEATFTYDTRDPDVIDDYPDYQPDDLVAVGFGQGKFGLSAWGSNVDSDPFNSPRIAGQSTLPLQGELIGRIDSIEITNLSTAFTQATLLTQFATGDTQVPMVSSGSPIAAFDLAWQLAGMRRSLLPYGSVGDIPNGVYWSLQGHEAGFDLKNQLVRARDDSPMVLTYQDKNTPSLGQYIDRNYRVKNMYASGGWGSVDQTFLSLAGTGSSPTVTRGETSVIAFTMAGADVQTVTLNYGPDQQADSTGKTFTITIDGILGRTNIEGQYRQAGSYAGVSVTGDLLNLTYTNALRVVITAGWSMNNEINISVSVGDFFEGIETLSTGNLPTGRDAWAAPWTHDGGMRGLYTFETTDPTFDPTDMLASDWEDQVPLSITTAMAADMMVDLSAPILSYTGSLWDYICQVCSARKIDLAPNANNGLSMIPMLDRAIAAEVWDAATDPSFSIGFDSIAAYTEIEESIVTMSNFPVIYDARRDEDSFSLTPGTTQVFTVEVTSVGEFVYNPEPVYQILDFRDEEGHPLGAFCVSGGDNLPIQPAAWVSYGGSLSVRKIDQTTLEVTVVCPSIPGVAGPYSLGVSDGDNDYPCLRVVGQTGGTIIKKTRRYESGAEKSWSPAASGASITNCAATTPSAVTSLAYWATVAGSGPSLTLSGSLPLRTLEEWQRRDILLIPGTTILHRNLQWRIMTASVTDISIDFTAACYTVYGNPYWQRNWKGLNQDEFKKYWDGKNYDDFKAMPLSGPDLDWASRGPVSKWSLFPADIPFGLTGTVAMPQETVLPANSTIPGGAQPVDGSDASKSWIITYSGTSFYPGQNSTPTHTIGTGSAIGVVTSVTTSPSAGTYPSSGVTPGHIQTLGNTNGVVTIITDTTSPGSDLFPDATTTPTDHDVAVTSTSPTIIVGGMFPDTANQYPSKTYAGSAMYPNSLAKPGEHPIYPDSGLVKDVDTSSSGRGAGVETGTPTTFPPRYALSYPTEQIFPGAQEDPYVY